MKFKNLCLIYKTLHDLAPPPLKTYIKYRNTSITTRAVKRGDCEAPARKTVLGKNVLSHKGSAQWNSLPVSVREAPTFTTFKTKLKEWLRSTQICEHD